MDSLCCSSLKPVSGTWRRASTSFSAFGADGQRLSDLDANDSLSVRLHYNRLAGRCGRHVLSFCCRTSECDCQADEEPNRDVCLAHGPKVTRRHGYRQCPFSCLPQAGVGAVARSDVRTCAPMCGGGRVGAYTGRARLAGGRGARQRQLSIYALLRFFRFPATSSVVRRSLHFQLAA